MLAIFLLTTFIIGKLRKRPERRRASDPGTGPPPPEQAQEKMQCTLKQTNSSIMKAEDGGSSPSQIKGSEVSALILKNSDHRYLIFTYITLDAQLRLPFILALQGSDQRSYSESGSHVDSVNQEASARFQNNRRRAQRRDSYMGRPCASSCSSSVSIDKNIHNSSVQDRPADEGLCSSFSCEKIQNIFGDGVATLASDGSDTAASTDPFKHLPELDKPTKKSSRKRDRKKGKKNKKSSSSSNNEVLDGSQSNCHTDTCEDGHIVMLKIAPNAANSVSDDTENYNSNCSNAAISGSLLATTSCASYINEPDELESTYSVQDLKDGVILDSSTDGEMVHDGNSAAEITRASIPNLDAHGKKNTACSNVSPGNKILGSVSNEWKIYDTNCFTGGIENVPSVEEGLRSITPDNEGPSDGNLHGASVDRFNERFIPSDATNDLHKEMPKTGDVLCSEGLADATTKNACRQESATSNTTLVASSKKREKRKQLQGISQQARRLKKGVNIHKQIGHEKNPSLREMVQVDDGNENTYGIKRQPLRMDCNAKMSLDGGNEKLKTSSVFNQIPEGMNVSGGAIGAIDSHTSLVKLEDKDLGEEIFEKYKEKTYPILNLEQSDNFSEEHQEETSVIVDVEAVPFSADVQASQYVQTDSSDRDQLIEFQSDCRPDLCASSPAGSCILVINESEGPIALEANILNSEWSKQNETSSAISKMLVSVGMENAGISGISKPSSKAPPSTCNTSSTRWNRKEVKEGKLCLVSDVKPAYDGLYTGSVNRLFSEEGQGKIVKLRHEAPCYVPFSLHSTDKKDTKITMSEINAKNIIEIVRQAYMSQIESEGVQLAIGGPVAMFERLLHSAATVISKVKSCQQCDTCKDEKSGDSLCRHRIPKIALRKFWRWYEGAGSYGIEVKVEDIQNFKSLGPCCHEYSAYFVPLLSSVQLFGHSRSSSSQTGMEGACNMDKSMEGSLSSAMPLHQSVKENVRVWQLNHDNFSSSSVGSSSQSGSPELLFEYFEAEPPQQRQPFFEKLKELVRGECTTNCQVYGDPSKLGNLCLHELHPSSWYSVAWYPIYRIPDGNFRAAFLTYHSFGHFIQRDAPVASLNGGTSIVCPAVGLQSYNTKAEPWYYLRTVEGNPTELGEVLKKRLQSLEATAHAMSRACILKGEQKSFNRHPDFEFFLSRRR